MALTRNITVNVSEGTKDRLPQNMERVRPLNEREAPSSREAPAGYQSFDQLVLAHDVLFYVDERGRQKDCLPYFPNPDKLVETKYACECRGTVNFA